MIPTSPCLQADFLGTIAPNLARRFRACTAAILTVFSLSALIGCQAPPAAEAPTAIELDVADYDTFVDTALSVLRRYDLPADYVDRWRGLIITEPATSGQWFEPWRVDSQGTYQTVEASLHTMRRKVRVDVLPVGEEPSRLPAPLADSAQQQTPEPGRYRLQVRVDKERYHAPARQITTSSGALAMYSTRVPTQAGIRGRRSESNEWVPLGRDVLLEQFLLDKLVNAAESATPLARAANDADNASPTQVAD